MVRKMLIDAAEIKRVSLVQRRLGFNNFEYIVEKC